MIDGHLLKRGALRHTPAGIPALNLTIGHSSIQQQAGRPREVRCEIDAVAIGEIAVSLSKQKLNQPLQFSGFLTRHSLKDRRLVMQVVEAGSSSGIETNTNQGD